LIDIKSVSTRVAYSLNGGTYGSGEFAKLLEAAASKLLERSEHLKTKSSFVFLMDKKTGTVQGPSNLNVLITDPLIEGLCGALTLLGHKFEKGPTACSPFIKDESGSFWQGFFKELITPEKVVSISYKKDAPFANGRATARFMLLRAATPAQAIPFLRPISVDIAGDNKTPSLFRRMVETKFTKKEDRDQFSEFLKDFIAFTAKRGDGYGRKKFSKTSFFVSFGDLHRRVRRVVKKTVRKGKKNVDVLTPKIPQKPSQLATVTPFEKPIVQELYEGPWQEVKELELRFEAELTPFEINFGHYLSELRRLENECWNARVRVAKQTKLRTVPMDKGDSIGSAIKKTVDRLAHITSIEEVVYNSRKYELNAIIILPSGSYTDSEGMIHPTFESAILGDQKLQAKYPRTSEYIKAFRSQIIDHKEKPRLAKDAQKDAIPTSNKFGPIAPPG